MVNIKKKQYAIVFAIILFIFSLGAYILMVRTHMQELWWLLDLDVYYSAGQPIWHNHNLYQALYTSVHLPFLYSPLAALLFALTSAIPFSILKVCMAIANIATLVGIIWVALGLLGYQRTVGRAAATLAIAGITLWMEPIQQTLLFGQVNLLLMGAIIVDLSLPDSKPWKGIGVGFAAGFKLTPAIFIVYLLLTRRFRAAGVALGTFVATIIIGFMLLPSESSQYWGGLFLNSSRVGVTFVSNQSLYGTVLRLFQGADAAHLYWLVIAGLVGIVGLGLATWASLHGEELLGILTCALTGLLVSPISWSHHWVWIVPLIVFVIHLAVAKQATFGGLAVGLIVLFSAWLSIIWQVPYRDNREFHWYGLQHLAGELYVVVGIFLLALLAFIVLRRYLQTENASFKNAVRAYLLAIKPARAK